MSDITSSRAPERVMRLALVAALIVSLIPLHLTYAGSRRFSASTEALTRLNSDTREGKAPAAPSIVATKNDALLIDADSSGGPTPGDTLRYSVTVSNTGDSDALGVVFSDTLDANTVLSGTLRASPLAFNDAYTTTRDTDLLVAAPGVLGNDTGIPAPAVTAFIGQPTTAGGTVSVSAAGAISYTPPASYSGADSFTYTVTNNVGSDTATVMITVYAPPDAVDDSYNATKNNPLSVAAPGVLSNDTGFPAPAVTPFSAATSQGGTVTVNADGSFIYTPTLNFLSPPDDTFVYTATNFLGSDSATVSIDVRDAPVAVDDPNYTTLINTTLNVPDGAGDLLDNDTLGSPAATLVSFGGGSLGGAVTDHAAGTNAALAGGTLTVNANGSFTLATPTITGTFTFAYRLQNVVGFDDGLATIAVQQAPLAVDDDPAGVAAYAVSTGGTLTVLAASGVIQRNDNPGFPAATLTSFGAGSLGGAVTDNAAGATVAFAGGNLTVNADGSLTVASPTITGTFNFQYRLTNAAGFDDATVTIDVRDGPVAVDDPNYTTLVNVTLNVPDGAGDLLDNDTLGFPAATLISFGGGSLGGAVTDHAAGTNAALAGGTLTVNANGSLTLATPTITGTFTFNYRIQNAAGSDDGLATIAVQQVPVAVDDDPAGVVAFAVNTAVTLNVNAATGVIQRNDNPGFPAATLTSFGAGSLGGAVTDNAAGATVALAGGNLTVNADGSLTLATPTITGTFSFQYRLTNAAGFDDATVTLQVRDTPVAIDDPNYATLVNTALNVPDGGTDLLANDALGFPPATLISFGGGSLGGVVTDHAAGTTATFGGALTVNLNGSFTFTPTTNFTGTFTFEYRIQNASGSDDGLATITVRKLPIAVDDDPSGVVAYTMAANDTLTVTTALGVVERNDDVGFPAATLTSFGGGSLGGAVTDHAAGTGAALAGGTLTVNADGSFVFATPTTPGSYNFQYRLTNAAGTDDATVTLQVQSAPDAIDDGPAVNSNPGDAYHTPLNTTLIIPDGAGDLLSNDSLGFPLGTLFSFGGGALGGAVTDHAAGTTATCGGSCALTVNANGSFIFTPTLNFTGYFTFTYRLQNALGSDDAFVTLAVGARASATDDARDVLGNVRIDTSTTPFSVLDNDTGDGVSISAYQATSASNGQVVLNTTTGHFTYNPAPGFESSDTFTYTLSNGFGTDVGTVTLTVNDMIWFIDHSAGGGGDGRITSPFNTVASFNSTAADDQGDIIFLYQNGGGNYSGNLTLLDTQQLIGQGVNLAAVTGITPPPGSATLPGTTSNPTLINAAGNGVTLGQNNTLRGMTISDTLGTDIIGSSFATLTVTNVTLNGTGQAISLTTGTLAATFSNVSSSSSATSGINLNSVAGSMAVAGTTGITGPTGDGVNVQSSTGSFNFGTLNITNTGGRSIFASNGGTLTAGAGTVATTNNAAIDIDNTALNLTFSSVTSTNSVGAGIDLNTVSGTFNASGGSISGSTGAAFIVNAGNAAITYGGTLSKTSAGRLADLQNRTGGAVTLSNTLTCNTSCTGIIVNGNSSGSPTFTFSGATKTINTGASPAVTLSNNTGATVNFSNGGLDIDTTSGAGFSATGGGTLNVIGANNSATSTTGTAVNIANTTIGASGVTFASVSANGAPNGILLNNTGSGAFTVNGGTIQNTSGDGVSLTSAQNITFDAVTIANTGAHGINGTSVSNFILRNNSLINDAGNAANENGVFLSNLSGTAQFLTSTIQSSSSRNVYITNTLGTLSNLTIQGNTISSAGTAAVNGDGVFLQASPGSNAIFTAVTVRNNNFTNNPSTGFRASIEGTSSIGLIDISNNTFTGNTIGVDLATNETASIDFDIHDNATMNGTRTQVNIAANDPLHNNGVGPTMEGHIRNNNITTSPTGNVFIAMWIVSDGDGNITVNIANNTINNFGDSGIDVESRGGTGDVHARIANNSATTTAPLAVAGMFLRSGNGTPGETNLLCVNLISNNMNGGVGAIADYTLDRFATPSTFQIQGLTPASATAAQAAAYVITTDSAPPATADALPGTTNYMAATCSTVSFAAAPASQFRADAQRVPGLGAPIPNEGRAASAFVNYNIGTLPAGKSVTIVFDVTINDPVPNGVTQVSNQGQVSGGNFVTVLTDDPTTGTPNDPTVTPFVVTRTIYLPIVTRNFANAPDLIVQNISVSSNNVQVAIKNQGLAAVADEFWVDLYINPSPAPTMVNQIWPNLSSQGLVWGVTNVSALTPGGVITLTIGDAYYQAGLSNFSGTFSNGMQVYVQADSAAAGSAYGAVLETHEATGGVYNNIGQKTVAGLALIGGEAPRTQSALALNREATLVGLPARPEALNRQRR